MADRLGKKHLKALDALCFECAYEDHHKGGTENFILRGNLPLGIGEKTLSDLVRLGLVITGLHRWHSEIGFRPADAGRRELEGR